METKDEQFELCFQNLNKQQVLDLSLNFNRWKEMKPSICDELAEL